MSDVPERRLSMVRIVDSPFCVAIDDGNKVHESIAGALDAGAIAIVSFLGVRRLTTAFLNAAIGQLYNEYGEDSVRDRLRIVDASQDDLRLLKRVVDNAKNFFSRSDRGSRFLKNLLGDG
jgi:hypothetical protein